MPLATYYWQHRHNKAQCFCRGNGSSVLPDKRVVHRASDQRVVGLQPEFTTIYHRRAIHLDQQQALAVTTTSNTVQLNTQR